MPDIAPPPKGNQRGLRHGGHARLEPQAVQAVADGIRPYLPVQHQADDWAVAELADALIRVQRFRDYLEANDPFTTKSKAKLATVRSAMRWEDKLHGRVLRLLKELGMTPQARAKLGLAVARTVSLAEAMSEPDPQRRAELLHELGVDANA